MLECWCPAALLPIQLPVDMFGKAENDGLILWVPATHVGDQHGVLGVVGIRGVNHGMEDLSVPATLSPICVSAFQRNKIYL